MREQVEPRHGTGRGLVLGLLLAALSLTFAWGEEEKPPVVPLVGFRTNLLFTGQVGRVQLPAEGTMGAVAAEVTGDVLRLAERAFPAGAPRYAEVQVSHSGRALLTIPKAGVRHYEVAVPELGHDLIQGARREPVAWDDVKGQAVLLVGIARAAMDGVGWALECAGDVGTVPVLGIPAAKPGVETGVLGLLDARHRRFQRAWSRVHVIRPDATKEGRARIVMEQGDLVLFPVPGTRSHHCEAEVEGDAVVVPWQVMRWGIAHALRPGAAKVNMHRRHWQAGRRGGGIGLGEDRRRGGAGAKAWTVDVEVVAPSRGGWAEAAMESLASALEARASRAGDFPKRLEGLRHPASDTGHAIGPADLIDPWGRPYRLHRPPPGEVLFTDGGDQGSPAYRLESAGPDGKEGTADDLVLPQPTAWWTQAEIHEEEPEPE